MAVVVRISRSSVADPVTALASVSVTFSGVTQQYGIVGYASGRLVALALPPPPASLATKPDPPIVRPYVPGPAPIMVRTPTRPSDGAKVSFPSPEADRLASELAGIETVRSPSTMSPDPPAPRTLPREIVLRKVSTEGIRDLCYTDGRLHVAIGDLGVAVYSLEPGSGAVATALWPFSAPEEYTYPEPHSYHRCPRTASYIFPVPCPRPEERLRMPDPSRGVCAGLFSENTTSCPFLELTDGMGTGSCFEFPVKLARGQFVLGFDGHYLLMREVVASVSSDSISRRLVVKNWAGIIAENSAPVIPEGSAEPSVARTPTEVLSIPLPPNGPAGEAAALCDRYLVFDNGKKCLLLYHLPSAKRVGEFRGLSGTVASLVLRMTVTPAELAIRRSVVPRRRSRSGSASKSGGGGEGGEGKRVEVEGGDGPDATQTANLDEVVMYSITTSGVLQEWVGSRGCVRSAPLPLCRFSLGLPYLLHPLPAQPSSLDSSLLFNDDTGVYMATL